MDTMKTTHPLGHLKLESLTTLSVSEDVEELRNIHLLEGMKMGMVTLEPVWQSLNHHQSCGPDFPLLVVYLREVATQVHTKNCS